MQLSRYTESEDDSKHARWGGNTSICLVFWATLVSCGTPLFGQEAFSPPPSPDAMTDVAEQKDDLDALLDLADKDAKAIQNVRVAPNPGQRPVFDTQITTASRQANTVGKTPAAVYVITNEMIRRSGATSIPEALRLAPGVNVSRVDSNKWAISIRGFNSIYSNKLLVQIDGRTVYDALYAGTFWDVQDYVLEDIDRIEIIRGPGASVWGANAVNGVINIISKKATETQGIYAQTIVGTWDKTNTSLRYGGTNGEDLSYRVYGKWFERDSGWSAQDYQDDWRQGRMGFRMDWNVDGLGEDFLTWQGDLYHGYSGTNSSLLSRDPRLGLIEPLDQIVSGGNTLLRWSKVVDEDTGSNLQFYYDRAVRRLSNRPTEYTRDTYDIDYDVHTRLTERQRLVAGVGFRRTSDHLTNLGGSDSASKSLDMFSYFVQDEFMLVDDLLYLTPGCKFLHNTYTDFEYQPTLRLLLTPNDQTSLWSSVSRAVRTPARINRDRELLVPTGQFMPVLGMPVPVLSEIRPNPGFISEDVMAYEAGIRRQETESFGWDLAGFVNVYDNLYGFVQGPPSFSFGPPPTVIVPVTTQNVYRAESYGFELAGDYQLSEWWRLRSGYSFLTIFAHEASVPGVRPSDSLEGQSPQNQLYSQSSWNLGSKWDVDLIGRYVDSIPAWNVPSYFVTDLRLGYRPRESVEWFVVGRHLFDPHHPEHGTENFSIGPSTEVRAELYGGVNLRY